MCALCLLWKVAERHNLPIIADEIYENMVFDGEEFYGFAPLSKHVPILSCGGIAKRFLVPGWRLGWVVIHDRDNRFEPEIRPGMTKVSQLILGANSLVQATLPTILTQCPDEFFKKTLRLCHTNAKLVYETLSKVD
jgi:tyrosine aminotransferase